MGFRLRGIQASLHEAEVQEICDSEASLYMDLRAALTPEIIRGCVQINFGPNKNTFKETLRTIGVPDSIKQSRTVHMICAELYSDVDTQKFPIEPLIESDFNPVDLIDVLQRENWASFPSDFGGGERDVFWTGGEQCATSITLANTLYSQHDGPMVDRNQPLIIISAAYLYAPQFAGEKYERLPGYLARADRELGKEYSADKALRHFAAYLAISEGSIEMPECAYVLTVGSHEAVINGLASCRPQSFYEFNNGRLSECEKGIFA